MFADEECPGHSALRQLHLRQLQVAHAQPDLVQVRPLRHEILRHVLLCGIGKERGGGGQGVKIWEVVVALVLNG